jgi:hypothetical protein
MSDEVNSNDLIFNEKFNNIGYTERNLALKDLLLYYAKFKSLKQSKNRGRDLCHLVCRFKNCSFSLHCRIKFGVFTISNELSSLNHVIKDEYNNITGLCSGLQTIKKVNNKLGFNNILKLYNSII